MALDEEYWRLAPAGVCIHFTRLDIVELPYGPEHARAVAEPDGLRAATRTLVRIDPGVVAFACTSASFVDGIDGEARIRAAIESVGVPHATTASGALIESLRLRGVSRVALGTPYQDTLGERLRDFLRQAGFEPGSLVNLGYTEEEESSAPPRRSSRSSRAPPCSRAPRRSSSLVPTCPPSGSWLGSRRSSACPSCRRTRCSWKRRCAGWTDRPWAWLRPPSTADRHWGEVGVATHAMSGTDGGAVIGILYPGYAAESEYVRAGRLVGGSARFPVVHTSVGRDTHEIDALMDTGAAWRLEEGWGTLREERPDAVMWACTSGSFVFGLDGARDQARRLSEMSGIPASSTSLAFVAALEALGIDRVAVGATYPDDVDERFRTFLEDAGVQVVRIGGLGIMDASDGARLPRPTSWRWRPRTTIRRRDAILLPDTAVHTLEHLPAIAASVGKVVLSANQVTVWQGLRLVGRVPESDPLGWGSPAAPSGRELSAPPSGRGPTGGGSRP